MVHLSQSSAKGASPCGTSIRALQRVQVLVVHLSKLCKGCKSLWYSYHTALAKGASPRGTPIRALQRVQVLAYHKALQNVQVPEVHLSQSSVKSGMHLSESSAKDASP